MNLITTCPSCLSQYSVSPETLRVADGWVGCGQCGYVYDATKALKNVPVLHQETLDAPVQPPPARAPEPVANVVAVAHANAPLEEPIIDLPKQAVVAQGALGEQPEPDPLPLEIAQADARPPQPSAEQSPVSSHILSAKLREALVGEAPEQGTGNAAAQQADDNLLQQDEPLLQLEVDPAPRMTEDAKRAAQLRTVRHEPPSSPVLDDAIRTDPWNDFDDDPPGRKKKAGADPFKVARKKDTTLLQSVLLSVFLLALIFQVVLYYRDFLSSTIPAMRAPLQQACLVLKCKVHSWRNIDAVVIQHASLTQNDAGYYKMNLAVKNSAAQKVAMPAVELSLLDANGTIMLRRVLSPEDLRAPEVLETGKVWEGEWMIQIAVPLPLSNYKIQVLYP